jgi:hypothetical protein
MNELLDQIKTVAEARAKEEALRSEEFKLRDAWNIANEKFLNELAQSKTATIEAEAKLRELTLKTYQETGSKAPAPGVGIREVKVYSYDSKDALEWAKEHKLALALDKKAFEGYAKNEDIDFVSIHTEPQATIAADLSAALKEA